MIAAMKGLMQLKIPPGLPFKKIEASVQTVTIIKTCIQAVGQRTSYLQAASQLARCKKNLEQTVQSSWCHYLSEQRGQVLSKVLEAWLRIEGKAAMVQRQSVLAPINQQRKAKTSQQPSLRTQSLHDKNGAKRNAI